MDIVSIDFLLILGTIILFTIFQSIFGVGLLVFGTPTLLLFGYSFPEVLSYLLPSSITVSFFQIYNRWEYIDLYRINVIFYMVPMVIIGIVINIFFLELNLYLIVGLILLFTSVIRYSEYLNDLIAFFLSNNYKLGFLFVGFIHGLTNLGGAFLVMVTNSIYNSKKEIQPNIAYAYLFMAISQIIILLISQTFIFTEETLIFPVVSGLIFLYLGNYIFESTSESFFYNLMSFFIAIYGLILIFKSF